MNSYPLHDILINGREVSIESIVNGSANAESDFESKTFAFIAEWLRGRETFVQHTSGSTGAPKPISITRSQMIASARSSIRALGLKEGDTGLLCISPDFIGGKMMLVRSLLAGMRIIAVTPVSNPLSLLPENLKIDFVAMVPYQLYEILQSKSSEFLNRIRIAIIGGATVNNETEKKLQVYSCLVYSTYGMTETISHIALRPLNGKEATDYYRTLAGIRISADDRSCLVIEWSQLPDKIVTNDIVEILTPDTFRWVGRWDNIINTGGIKVVPEKVEQQLTEIFAMLDIGNRYFIGSISDPKLGNKVTLFVEGEIELPILKKVENRIAEVISKVEAPKQIIHIKSFVITENGKINRQATVKSYMDRM